MAHVVRSAIDHGLETPEVRAAVGKPPYGCSKLGAAMSSTSGDVTIQVRDDGRGIDFDRLRETAQAKGIHARNPEDLLFVDGLSSKEQATATSGRGVGTAAVRASVKALGGEIEVETELGRGATFRFVFPAIARPEPKNLADQPPAPAA